MANLMMYAHVASLCHANGGRGYTGIEILYSALTAFGLIAFTAIVSVIVYNLLLRKFIEREAVEITAVIAFVTFFLSLFTFQYIMAGDFIWNVY
jgi:hypothetical protein